MKARIWFTSQWARRKFLKHTNVSEVNNQLLVVRHVDAWLVHGPKIGLLVDIRPITFIDEAPVMRNNKEVGKISSNT